MGRRSAAAQQVAEEAVEEVQRPAAVGDHAEREHALARRAAAPHGLPEHEVAPLDDEEDDREHAPREAANLIARVDARDRVDHREEGNDQEADEEVEEVRERAARRPGELVMEAHVLGGLDLRRRVEWLWTFVADLHRPPKGSSGRMVAARNEGVNAASSPPLARACPGPAGRSRRRGGSATDVATLQPDPGEASPGAARTAIARPRMASRFTKPKYRPSRLLPRLSPSTRYWPSGTFTGPKSGPPPSSKRTR